MQILCLSFESKFLEERSQQLEHVLLKVFFVFFINHGLYLAKRIQSCLPRNEVFFFCHVLAEFKSSFTAERISENQLEAVIDDLSTIQLVNLFVVLLKSFGEVSPVFRVIVDSIISCVTKVVSFISLDRCTVAGQKD